MAENFQNVYEDAHRADAYAGLEFPGTYYLAYRDLPSILSEHVRGRRAIDFGCGTGRSTRFLKQLGFETVGVDIAPDMLAHAREKDPDGDYRLVADGSLGTLSPGSFDLVLSAFTFDNVPTFEKKVELFRLLGNLLNRTGRIVDLVSAPEIYTHEWASFTTKDFPENRNARSGEQVKIVMLDVPDRRPVEDILCTDEDYAEIFRRAGMERIAVYRPLAAPDEPFRWVNEIAIAPWTIYALKNTSAE